MIKLQSNGKFTKTADFLDNMSTSELADTQSDVFYRYAEELIYSLSAATPRDTGKTASSWSYDIERSKTRVKLNIYNSNISDGGACVAILIQYGHGTRGGTYVQGIDYINPACKEYFDRIESSVWKEVAK